jgi:hypothetical protein
LQSAVQDPPDEVSTGAKFLGCIPFPFLTIRTNKLEVRLGVQKIEMQQRQLTPCNL